MNPLRSVSIAAVALAAAALPAVAQDAVDIQLEYFGVGNYYRAGEVTAAKIILSNTLTEATGAWVQWEIPNADGDVAEMGREIVLNPGQDSEMWLYAPIPPRTDTQSVWSVRVFEYRDGRRLGEIGGARISPSSALATQVPMLTDLIAVVNDGDMGLDYYTAGADARTMRPVSSHELTIPVGRIRPRTGLPDRWQGLTTFQTIVWGNELASELPFDCAEALREWIRRGGHLVIVLPSAGDPWGLGRDMAEHELADLMPPMQPTQVPDVHYSELLPVLSKATDPFFHSQGRFVQNEGKLTIRTFPEIEQASADTNWYQPLMKLPRGDTVAIQRTYGHGRITIIGIPLGDNIIPTFTLPEADVFWNEILGRRTDTPTVEEITKIDRDLALLAHGITREVDLGSGALFSEQINMDREAAAGLLLSLFLFVVYWIVAGPGGFAALKIYKQQHHAWIAFAGAAAVFTAIAWMGVALTKANDVQLKHVTYLDRIARPEGERQNDPQFDRASSWMSVYLPGYGPTEITIESDRALRDLLYSWETPGVATNPFPNADRYTVDVGRDFATARIPSRATSTQLHAKWLGNVDPNYGGIGARNIRVNVVGGRDAGFMVDSVLTNEFALPIVDGKIIIVTNRRLQPLRYARNEDGVLPHVPPTQSGGLRVSAYMWALPDPWDAGKSIDISQFATDGGQSLFDREVYDEYVENESRMGITGMAGGGQVRGLDQNQQRRYIEILSIFNQLTPPEYLKARENDPNPDQAILYREIGRELDLSSWFVQPCIIVIGYLEGAESPVPITVNGGTPVTDPESLTVVRWIYPLPQDPEIMFDDRTWGLDSDEEEN